MKKQTKDNIEIIGTMYAMTLILIGAMFGWVWQIVIPVWFMFIASAIVISLIAKVYGYAKRIK